MPTVFELMQRVGRRRSASSSRATPRTRAARRRCRASLSRPSVRQGRRPTAGSVQLPAAMPSLRGADVAARPRDRAVGRDCSRWSSPRGARRSRSARSSPRCRMRALCSRSSAMRSIGVLSAVTAHQAAPRIEHREHRHQRRAALSRAGHGAHLRAGPAVHAAAFAEHVAHLAGAAVEHFAGAQLDARPPSPAGTGTRPPRRSGSTTGASAVPSSIGFAVDEHRRAPAGALHVAVEARGRRHHGR